MDSVTRFDDRASDYVRYRPSYPAAAIDRILEGLGPPDRLVAADIGAGTGISARLLGDRGVRVLAVEPGVAMRGAAAAHPNVTWIGGTAEATGLASGVVGLVLAAQAFHWFRPPQALAEFARILEPSGRLAIMWNRRSTTDPLTAGFRQAILDVGGETAAERMPFDADVVSGSGLFSPVVRATFPNAQRLDLEGVIGRARSASGVPKTGALGEQLVSMLRDLHARYADCDGGRLADLRDRGVPHAKALSDRAAREGGRPLELRQGQGDEFRGDAPPADGDDDELAVVDHVGHRNARRARRQRHLVNDCAGLLVDRAEHPAAAARSGAEEARAVGAEEQRLRHHQRRAFGLAGLSRDRGSGP